MTSNAFNRLVAVLMQLLLMIVFATWMFGAITDMTALIIMVFVIGIIQSSAFHEDNDPGQPH